MNPKTLGTLIEGKIDTNDIAISPGSFYLQGRLMGTAIRSNTPGPSRGLHYHAFTHTSSAVVLQRDNQDHTMIDGSTRDTDIPIGQYKIDSELTNQ